MGPADVSVDAVEVAPEAIAGPEVEEAVAGLVEPGPMVSWLYSLGSGMGVEPPGGKSVTLFGM